MMNQRLLHTPEGVRDIYGSEYARKLSVQNTLLRQFRLYGFEDIQTPTFEFFDVFSSEIGTTPSKELYKFFDKEGNTLVLRPDFTPSMARCAAKYFMEEKKPIRFCYAGNTFTNTSNLQGKLKEVTQLGVELIGDDSVYADAEMLCMVINALKAIGLTKFQVSIGEVEYFKGICEDAGLDEETELALRDFISTKNYFGARDLLMERQIKPEDMEVLLKSADLFGDFNSLKEARSLANHARSLAAIDRLEQVYEVLKLYGVEEYVSFDLGMLSKYNYYTGIIFKAYTYGIGDAIVKGGRYDSLLSRFGKEAPAIGCVVVIDDVMEALKRQGITVPVAETKQVLTYRTDDFEQVLQQATRLRKKGVSVELRPAD